jgi:glycosyltransferase involved in cell wall biosynthesis
MTLSTTPLVSIVTPSYKQAPCLGAAVRSMLDPDCPQIEYMVIDGGHTDGSLRILQQPGDRLAYRESEPDSGRTDAIN